MVCLACFTCRPGPLRFRAFVMPGPLRGVRMDSPDTLRARWISEAERLRTYRRQRATIHCDQTRSLEDIVSDAEDLDLQIALTKALMEEIEDELNARRPGTYEHAVSAGRV